MAVQRCAGVVSNEFKAAVVGAHNAQPHGLTGAGCIQGWAIEARIAGW